VTISCGDQNSVSGQCATHGWIWRRVTLILRYIHLDVDCEHLSVWHGDQKLRWLNISDIIYIYLLMFNWHQESAWCFTLCSTDLQHAGGIHLVPHLFLFIKANSCWIYFHAWNSKLNLPDAVVWFVQNELGNHWQLLSVADNIPPHASESLTTVFILALLTYLQQNGPWGCVSVRPPLQLHELSCCQADWLVKIEPQK